MNNKMSDYFRKFSQKTSELVGSPWASIAAFVLIIAWAITGPLFGFSNTWQLVINTGTTIITFLMVFLIQNTQNRDNKAIQLKLDELIVSQKDARNSMVELEDLSDEELKRIQDQFNNVLQQRCDRNRNNGQVGENGEDESKTARRPGFATISSDKMKAMAPKN